MDLLAIAQLPGLLEEHRLPGMAVGVCTADSVLWSGGFGVTRAGGAVPVGTGTMFSVQSCSKMYTATAVLHAVQEGLVELDVPIVRYLPEFRVRSSFEEHPERRITLRQLLSHTAGFTHEAPVGSNYLVGRASFEAHCRSISGTWLRFPVGHHFEYSNLGIDLAGYVLQRCSGMPFHEFVRRSLFVPLGLDRTSFDARVIARDADRAIGHSTGYSRLPVRVPVVAAGGLYTSVADACRFVQFHLANGESLAELYRGRGYGLGVALTKANGIPVRGHGGGGFGFLSDMYWAPEAGIGVVVLTNSTAHPLQWKLASDIFRELVGERPPAPAPTRSVAPADSLAGRYDQLRVVVEDGQGFLVEGESRKPVQFVGPHEFRVGEELYRFHEGPPAYLESVEDGRVKYRNDVPEPAPAAADGPWNRDYAIHVSGVRDGTVRLRKENGVHLFDHWGGGTYRLREYRPGLYLSSNGEMLDLTRVPPTYANVRLHGLSDPGA
ncbi:CubicO group peptidase (beta-lactamase class C family) [Kribbella aluminosa]|uniref:CubicO group peptidase (Beta-lactamase class C family) n=1 Tax=Kribbella aluminosa TaxID=416017 RepID=A0ABS4UMN0_9ACTN|nr:serine hydrolase domain-containing protein [Kribbella aluminosa]MBP2352888.1 CubicO group peptidase (beta-lactamase class C family) [Kribbella aluminosa]